MKKRFLTLGASFIVMAGLLASSATFAACPVSNESTSEKCPETLQMNTKEPCPVEAQKAKTFRKHHKCKESCHKKCMEKCKKKCKKKFKKNRYKKQKSMEKTTSQQNVCPNM